MGLNANIHSWVDRAADSHHWPANVHLSVPPSQPYRLSSGQLFGRWRQRCGDVTGMRSSVAAVCGGRWTPSDVASTVSSSTHHPHAATDDRMPVTSPHRWRHRPNNWPLDRRYGWLDGTDKWMLAGQWWLYACVCSSRRSSWPEDLARMGTTWWLVWQWWTSTASSVRRMKHGVPTSLPPRSSSTFPSRSVIEPPLSAVLLSIGFSLIEYCTWTLAV